MSAPTPQSFVQAAIAAEREQWTGQLQGLSAATGYGDPTITPFVKGMMAAGWAIDKAAGGGDLMEECPECRERYVYTFRLDRTQVRACPFCSFHEISEGEAA